MGNKVFTLLVLLLWGATTTWLMVSKILPPLFQGSPPTVARLNHNEPVAWRIEMNGRPCGMAVTQAVEGESGTTEVHSRVVMDRVPLIPLPDIAPQVLSGLMRNLGETKVDVRTRSTLDTLNELSGFETRVWVNDLETPLKMRGRVFDGTLNFEFKSGEISHSVKYPWTSGRQMFGELTPDSKLLMVHVGRKWRREVCSPFGFPNNTVELVESEVVSEELLQLNGDLVKTKRVESRTLSSTGVAADDQVRGIMWVAEDGRVVRQDIRLMSVQLRFDRLSADETDKLAGDFLDLQRWASVRSPAAADDEEPDKRRDDDTGAGE